MLGHALRKALRDCASAGAGLTEMASEVGTALVTGSSAKAALDLDLDDPGARQQALTLILDTLTTVEHWLACQPAQAEGTCQVATSLAVAHQVQTQDITLAPMGR